jgi:hypothetical protein
MVLLCPKRTIPCQQGVKDIEHCIEKELDSDSDAVQRTESQKYEQGRF